MVITEINYIKNFSYECDENIVYCESRWKKVQSEYVGEKDATAEKKKL